MITLPDYEYYAFISYKREDEKWAKWLHKKLESYGFPVALRKDNPALPSKIKPVFRDKTDLTGGNLKEEIENALRESKYLIVICSPRAAQSPWVSKEVQYFIDNGRENNIIPFIIGGSPNAKNPEEECFPEGLRLLTGEKEILGININEMGRDAAAIKVIARMFGLRFDTLWQRHERAKRRMLIGWGILAAIVIAVITGVAIFINSQNLELKQANDAIKAERDRANEKTEEAKRANKSLKIANDSIKKQSAIITQTNIDLERSKKNLEQSNRELAESNRRFAEERDNVKKANWKMMENRARAVAEKANQLIDEGDSYTALALCQEILPNNYSKLEIPYLPEVERVFRRAVDYCFSGKIYGRSSKGVKESFIRPNYRQIITCGLNDELDIWDAETGAHIRELFPQKSWDHFAFSPNGQYLIAASLLDIFIWDLNTENDPIYISSSSRLSGRVEALFCDDINLTVGVIDKNRNRYIKVLDMSLGNVKQTIYNPIPHHMGYHCYLVPSSTGRFIAYIEGTDLALYDNQFNKIGEWNFKNNIEIKFSPLDSYIAIQSVNNYRIININDIKQCIERCFDFNTHFCFKDNESILIGGIT